MYFNNNILLCIDCNDVEIQNLVDIRKEMNYELSMRVTTEVKNNNIFYTDLNGFQVITIHLYTVYF
jgi:hypothetical protein